MGFLPQTKTNLNFLKISFVNIRITISSNDYKKWAKNYLNQNFNATNWDLKTVLHLLPFLIGFYQMILNRYQNQTFSCFFEKTLPGYKLVKEDISLETFELIKSKTLDLNQIKQIHIYNDSFIVEYQKPTENYEIGFFSNEKLLKPNTINSTQYKLNLNDLNGFFNNNIILNNNFFYGIYYNLDELPLKLEEIKNFREENPKIKSRINNFFDSQIKNVNSETINFSFTSKANEQTPTSLKQKTNLLIPNFFQNAENLSSLKGLAIKKNQGNQNKFLFKEKENFVEQNLLQAELDLFFYKTNLRPFIFSKKEKIHFKNFSYSQYSPKETISLLTTFFPIKTNKFLSPRKLSGYRYPDLNTRDIYSLYLNLFIKHEQNNIALKINLSSSFLPLIKENSLSPSFLEYSLSPQNRRDGFFGENVNFETNLEKLKQKNWEKTLVKEITRKENINFDQLDDFDAYSWFLKSHRKTKTNQLFTTPRLLLSLINKNSNKLFCPTQLEKDKLIYHYNFFSENLLNKNFTKNSHFGEIYKKIPNFSNSLTKNNFSFFESWEPISFDSWMIILQFSIGLFLLKLLKDLYKDYGKELVDYILQFASSSGIDVEEIKEQYLYDDPGYRLIKKVQRDFKDIAGIDNILPELGEIVWFLRNSGRSAKFKNSIPKGILLIGPPGTGKTLLVQALAGEAQVPVIVESGSLLTNPQEQGRGIEKLKKIFDQARQLSPCILFIDEVDTIGEKRQNIIQTAMGGDELIESVYEKQNLDYESNFIPKPVNLDEDITPEKDLEYQLFRGDSENPSNLGLGQFQKNLETKKTRLNLLTQFLVELDGLKQRQGVIVIGATNRPTVLDPALIRPGRFDKILNIELPGKNKRIEILKLYSKKLQIDKTISWDYLANRTQGFSAADLAAAMNESAIQSILKQSCHTIETIERGIDLITSYSNENNQFLTKTATKTDPFFISRLAYYQAGKACLQTLLPNDQPVVILHLWPRQKNARHARFYEKSFNEMKSRVELELQLIGLYAGKAAELLKLSTYKNLNTVKRWQSDLGVEDLLSATFLANLMVDKWFFYSDRILTRKNSSILNNRNAQEFRESEKLELLTTLDNQIEDEIEIEQIAKLFRTTGYQQRGFGPWWQIQVSKQISEIESFFADWYRIYLPDPEESILNLEWNPPDEFYHTNESLKKLSQKSTTSFNDLYKIERDYIYHGLILNAFNKAFSDLENLREFLDYFADYLIRYNLIRETEIRYILKDQLIEIKKPQKQKIKIFHSNWGKNSRRKNYRFINFETLNYLKKVLD